MDRQSISVSSVVERLKYTIFPDKKAKEKQSNDQYGFQYLEGVTMPSSNRTLSCLLRGLLIFLIVYTPISLINTAFEIEEASVTVPILLLLISLMIGFFNFNGISRVTGYLLFFFSFLLISGGMSRYVNSGMNALLNIIFEKASYDLQLEAIRTYQEVIPNRALTIPMFYFYLGIALLIITNFILNSFMSAPFVLILSFPFLFLSFYFDFEPKAWHYLSYAFLLMTIKILKNSEQYNLPDKKAKLTLIKRKKKSITYHNVSQGKVMWQTAGFVSFLLACLLILSNVFYPSNRFSTPSDWKALKQSTKDYARIFFKSGLEGFLNKESTAGVGYGTLGAGSVNPSFETDLIITFAPQSYETFYLKTYIGTTYTGTSWEDDVFCTPDVLEELENLNHTYLDELWANRSADSGENADYFSKSKIQIQNINTTTKYVPYYTSFSSEEYPKLLTIKNWYYIAGLTNMQIKYDATNPYTLEYYSLPKELLSSLDFVPDPETAEYAYYISKQPYTIESLTNHPLKNYEITVYSRNLLNNLYLDICDNKKIKNENLLRQTLKQITIEQGLYGSAFEIVEKLQNYFKENYVYTLNPGSYDSNHYDFATYFLTQDPHGYCQHFATAATLLLRYCGIPARYVEGYAISFNEISRNYKVLEDEALNDWLEGNIPLDSSAVLQAEITDAAAHAWVEIFIPEFGWYPVEFTPSASENNDESFSFWENLANSVPTIDTSGLSDFMQIDWTFSVRFLKTTLQIVITGAVLFCLYLFTQRQILRKKYKRIPYHTGYSQKLLTKYRLLNNVLYQTHAIAHEQILHSDFEHFILPYLDDPIQAATLKTNLNMASYGPDAMKEEMYRESKQLLQRFERAYKKQLSPLARFWWLVIRIRTQLQAFRL